MLVGQYDYAIDAKGRLNFPARFRDAMGETFIVTRWLDHCLAAFPAEEFEKVAAKIEEKGPRQGPQGQPYALRLRRRGHPQTSRAAFSCPPSCGSTRASTTM